MLYDVLLPIYFFFSQYNITCNIFHKGFAYHNETCLIMRATEREREREREREILLVCVENLRRIQQLRSCRAGQLRINTVPGQA